MNNFYAEYIQDVNVSRCEAIGHYIVDTGDTVRGAAKLFGISKSTVHKDITKKLKQENLELYRQVSKVLQFNKEERHIRGGIATRDKYQTMREIKARNKQKNNYAYNK